MSGGAGDGRLAGKVALVTGAGGGIGREIALRLGSEGAAVGVLDRDAGAATESAELVAADGARALGVTADISARAAVRAAVESVEAELGAVDVLVNNAGIAPFASLLEIEQEEWDRVLAINLGGPFVVTQEVGGRMAARGGGKIVNITSVAAHRAHDSQAAYAVSKAGIEALTRASAFELGPHGVNVNAVAPGPVMTPLNEAALSDADRAARLARLSVGRLGVPADVAGAVAFLASAEADYFQGSVLVADGGFLIGGVRATGGDE